MGLWFLPEIVMMRTAKKVRNTLMPPARRRKKTKTKKHLVRFSLVLNALLLAVVIFTLGRNHWVREIIQSAPRQRPAHGFFSNKPKLTIVVDDIGNTMNDRQLLRNLGDSVTYAVLPLLQYSRFFGLLAGETGAEVILHLPFESVSGTIPGPGLITSRMPADQVLDVMRRGLASVPRHRGVNNHMGSAGTANPELMDLIMGEMKRRGLFFLDSLTTPVSAAYPAAKRLGVPALKRDFFLDNEDSPEAIRRQIVRMTALAREKGYAIGIGHYHHNTLTVLNEEIPKLKNQGYQFVPLETLLDSTR